MISVHKLVIDTTKTQSMIVCSWLVLFYIDHFYDELWSEFQCKEIQINSTLSINSLISQQMIKYCLLVLLLVAAYGQDDQTIMVSNPSNVVVESTIQDRNFASKYDTASSRRADFSRQAGDEKYSYSNEGGAEWVFSDGRKIWPIHYVSKYSFCICTDCPKNPATIYVGATSFFVLTYANGTFIGSGWGWSPLSTFTVKLNCGCDNRFILYVYNFWPSPLGHIIFAKQSTQGCYDCANLGITHYNRDTCQCECVNNQTCPCPVKSQVWLGYPSCGCMCPRSLLCNWRQYFDMRNCVCACKKICCPKGYIQNKQSCLCQPNWWTSDSVTASLSSEQECIQMVCPPSAKWSQEECKCI